MAAADERALLHLPPELMEHILGELCSDDLLHAAITCHELFLRMDGAAALGLARVTAQIPSSWLAEHTHADSQSSRTNLRHLRIMEEALHTCNIRAQLRKNSVMHMRNMLRVYLSTIAHTRICLGDECFEERRVAMKPGQMESGVKVQSLKATTDASAMLIDYLEHGVFRALDDENLESFKIVLSEDEASTRIFETWTVRHGTMHACPTVPVPGSASVAAHSHDCSH